MAKSAMNQDTVKVIREVLLRHDIDNTSLADEIFLTLFVLEDLGRITREDRRKLKRCLGQMRATEQDFVDLLKIPTVDLHYRGVVEDAAVAINRLQEIIKSDLDNSRPLRQRPTSEHGQQRLDMFECLLDAGLDDIWLCSTIISDILVSTGKSQSPIGKLRATIHQQLRNLDK